MIQPIEGGPYGLAEHQCSDINQSVISEVYEIVNEALVDPDLSLEATKRVLYRVLIARAWQTRANVGELTEVLSKLVDLQAGHVPSGKKPSTPAPKGPDSSELSELDTWIKGFAES